MVLYIVGDFVKEGRETHYSGELERMLSYKPAEKEIVVISPEGNTTFGDSVQINDEDLIYFGHSGKSIEHIPGEEHGLIQELPRYQEMFKKFEGSRFANPRELLLDNMSKRYLVRISQNGDLPVIKTNLVGSLDDLMQDEDLFVKPLISERSAGAHRLEDLDEQARKNLFDSYIKNGCDGQGLILQPFVPGILDFGERKVGIVDGEVTLCRLVNPDGSYNRASVTNAEREVCFNAWEYMKSQFPGIIYSRIDLIGDPNNPLINEIEAVNPNLTTRTTKTPYDVKEVKNHYTRLFEALTK